MKMTLPGLNSLMKPFIKLHLQSANMYELTTGEYTVVFELAFPLLLLPIHQLKNQPQVVSRQFPGYQLINLPIVPDHWYIYTSTIV